VATAEFAVCLPLLLLMLAGLWEIGRMIEVQQILMNATREGARQAASGSKTSTDVQNGVINHVSRAGLSTTGMTVTVENLTQPGVDPSAANQMDRLRISLSFPFANVRWAAMDYVITGSDLTAAAEWNSMRDVPLNIDTSLPID
jgi:Flp pilus assembly protein TadG